MKKSHTIQRAMEQAASTCQQRGGRLTKKRYAILELLLTSDHPLSAYEIADQYQQHQNDKIAPMSVYRMLDFLMEMGLVHKLTSTNKFVACEHIACSHTHEVPQFLICDGCESVSEVNIRRELIKDIEQAVANEGFKLYSPQFELHGKCKSCQKT